MANRNAVAIFATLLSLVALLIRVKSTIIPDHEFYGNVSCSYGLIQQSDSKPKVEFCKTYFQSSLPSDRYFDNIAQCKLIKSECKLATVPICRVEINENQPHDSKLHPIIKANSEATCRMIKFGDLLFDESAKYYCSLLGKTFVKIWDNESIPDMFIRDSVFSCVPKVETNVRSSPANINLEGLFEFQNLNCTTEMNCSGEKPDAYVYQVFESKLNLTANCYNDLPAENRTESTCKISDGSIDASLVNSGENLLSLLNVLKNKVVELLKQSKAPYQLESVSWTFDADLELARNYTFSETSFPAVPPRIHHHGFEVL